MVVFLFSVFLGLWQNDQILNFQKLSEVESRLLSYLFQLLLQRCREPLLGAAYSFLWFFFLVWILNLQWLKFVQLLSWTTFLGLVLYGLKDQTYLKSNKKIKFMFRKLNQEEISNFSQQVYVLYFSFWDYH